MKSEENLSIMQIMKNDLVRKNILNMIPSFYDIYNLSITSKQIASLIEGDIIKRNMMMYSDFQRITIKIKEGIKNKSNVYSLEDIEFEKDEYSCETLSEVNQFVGETIHQDNRISFIICNFVDKIKKREQLLFIKKLLRKINLNMELRKNSTILNLWVDFSCDNYMILHALSFMNHENIRRIELSQNVFLSNYCSNDKNKNLNTRFFDGFPNFHELLIYGSLAVDNYTNLMENKNIIDVVLKELSNRKNATLILKLSDWGYNEIAQYIHMVLEIANKYNIKVKYDGDFISLLLCTKNNCLDIVEDSINFPIKDFIFSVSITIENIKFFVTCMKNLQHFKNLETLELKFMPFDIQKSNQKMNRLKLTSLSLQSCDKLKNVKFDFSDYLTEEDTSKTEIFKNNLENICPLMPKSIERATIFNGFDLCKETANIFNEFMENINVLVMDGVSYKDEDCLNSFKNLRTFISFQNLPIKIPTTVEFLFIAHRNSWINTNESSMDKELLTTYSKKFSKKLQYLDDEYIFFNDIKKWNIYKKLLQEIYY
uniref:F-box domain-containing protein n=1 Tax=Strongyloides venezuelensis TaxID=75913 RepID=A0A0K0F493_STRVS